MQWTAKKILESLGNEALMPLDNAYAKPAAVKLQVFREVDDWAIVCQCFGFNTRNLSLDIHAQCFTSRKLPAFDPQQVIYAKLRTGAFLYEVVLEPVDTSWIENYEYVAAAAKHVTIRDKKIPIPSREELAGVVPVSADEPIHAVDVARYFGATARDEIFATLSELQGSILALTQAPILTLDEWRHPDIYSEIKPEDPTETQAFRMIAEVAATGNPALYQAVEPSNTHWSNWPNAGFM